MAFTTVFIFVLPFAIIAGLIYSYLILDFSKMYSKITNKNIRIFLNILTYLLFFILLTIISFTLSLLLMMWFIGLYILIIYDIIGIVLFIIRIVEKFKKR